MASVPEDIKLNKSDILCAFLAEPFESHGLPALSLWLQCRGIKVSTSIKERQVTLRYMLVRIHQHGTIKEGCKIIDVDCSYLCRKHQQIKQKGHNVVCLGLPPPLISVWESVLEENRPTQSLKVLRVYCIM